MTKKVFMKKSQAVASFKKLIGRNVMGDFYTIPREFYAYECLCFYLMTAWNRFTGDLFDTGSISIRQYRYWTNPFNKR